MKSKQHHRFIAFLTAVAVAITALGAAPARADDDDLLKALAAIAGIAIVGKVIHDQVQNRQTPALTQNRKKSVATPQRAVGPVYDTSPLLGIAPRPLPERAKRAQRRLLPGDCLRSTATQDGRVRYFGQRCLQQNYGFANQLPQACAVRVRGQNGLRRGYEARCLRSKGYQLARN